MPKRKKKIPDAIVVDGAVVEVDPIAEERRAPDQDAAIETAFVEGALPEEDRREPESEPVATEPPVAAAIEAEAPVTPTVELVNGCISIPGHH